MNRYFYLLIFTVLIFCVSGRAHGQEASSEAQGGRLGATYSLVYAVGGEKDSDGDGLSNEEEKAGGTNPNAPDTDKDGLVDSDEVLIYHTNPLKADSDDDGVSDQDELKKYRTFPDEADSDGDGLNDGDELYQHKTNPLKPDTDADGIADGEEIFQFKTDPLVADTDGDGVNDGEEVNVYVSDPVRPDSDGDGIVDAEDKCPTEPGTRNSYSGASGCPETKPEIWVGVNDAIVLTGVSFTSGDAMPTPPSREMLEKIYQTLQEHSNVAFEIRGYADGSGDGQRNLKLSQKRAEAVLNFLVSKGIASERLHAVGYGEENPITSNDTPAGRAQNRRIELHRLQ